MSKPDTKILAEVRDRDGSTRLEEFGVLWMNRDGGTSIATGRVSAFPINFTGRIVQMDNTQSSQCDPARDAVEHGDDNGA